MVIKKLVKNGAMYGAGVLTGIALVASEQNKDRDPDDIWKGESDIEEYTVNEARQHLDNIREYIEDKEYNSNRMFAHQDLKDLEVKFSDAIAEAEKNDEDKVKVELYDRQKLRWVECIFNIHPGQR